MIRHSTRINSQKRPWNDTWCSDLSSDIVKLRWWSFPAPNCLVNLFLESCWGWLTCTFPLLQKIESVDWANLLIYLLSLWFFTKCQIQVATSFSNLHFTCVTLMCSCHSTLDCTWRHLVFPVEEVSKLVVVNLAITINITVSKHGLQEFGFHRKVELDANFSQFTKWNFSRIILQVRWHNWIS